MSARQGKVTYSYFFRRKGAIHRKLILEFGTFLRAVNDRPYEWMTIDSPKFDGDSHTRKENWFGMTVLFDALTSPAKYQFTAPQNDTERVRERSIPHIKTHDLSADTDDTEWARRKTTTHILRTA